MRRRPGAVAVLVVALGVPACTDDRVPNAPAEASAAPTVAVPDEPPVVVDRSAFSPRIQRSVLTLTCASKRRGGARA
jgi:hypothetical protein